MFSPRKTKETTVGLNDILIGKGKGGHRGENDNDDIISSANGSSGDFDLSESGESLSTTKRQKQQTDMNKEEVKRLAQQESRIVTIWRRNVFLVLFLTAALVTTLTYIFLWQEDQEDFTTSVSKYFEWKSLIRPTSSCFSPGLRFFGGG